MSEYKELLYMFSSEFYFTYSKFDKETWGNIENAEAYLGRFWLKEQEYKEFWQPIQEGIFNKNSVCLPDLMFLTNFHIVPFVGGVIFAKDDFEKLRIL